MAGQILRTRSASCIGGPTSVRIATKDQELKTTNYELDREWHTYRVEVKGLVIRLLIDGAAIADTDDNQYLPAGQVGIYDTKLQLNIRSFKVMTIP